MIELNPSLQPRNASSLIDLMVFENEMCFNLLHPLNDSLEIRSIPVSKITVSIFLSNENAVSSNSIALNTSPHDAIGETINVLPSLDNVSLYFAAFIIAFFGAKTF